MPSVDNYFKQAHGTDNRFVLNGNSTIGGYDLTADRFEQILRNAPENTVFVKQASDLQNIDSTKNYMIDGSIDMGSQSIIVPEGGISISGLNGARDTSILYSSADNYTMFVSPVGGYSGNVVLESCTIDLTGTNSQVFNLDNDGNSNALDITGVNFGISPATTTLSMGHLSNYRQLLMNNVGFLFIDDGLTFDGSWTGIAVVTSIVVGFPAATLFKEGASFTVDNVRSDINFLSVNSASVLFDFQESNITSKGGMALTNVRSGADNAVPNLPGSSLYARYRNCLGIRNTYVGGQWTVTAQAATLLSGVAIGTPLKIAGTTTYTDLQWFTGAVDNAFKYEGDQTIEVLVHGNFSMSGTNGDLIKVYIYQWDDSASSYIQLFESGGATMNASGRAEGIGIHAFGVMDTNDRIEIWAENYSAARDVTLLIDGIVSVSERAA